MPPDPSTTKRPSRSWRVRREEAALTSTNAVVGTFRSAQVVGGRPTSLDTWRVTSPQPSIVTTVAKLLGGSTSHYETGDTRAYTVTTRTSLVRISLRIDAVLPELSGAPLRNRRTEKSPEQPGALTRIVFHLADLPMLGTFQLVSPSRSLAESLSEYVAAGQIGICELALSRFVDCSSTGASVYRSAISLAPLTG